MIKNLFLFCTIVLLQNCGISEDCLKGNGKQIVKTYQIENFTKVKVYSGVGLVIKEGANFEVKLTTSENIADNIEVALQDNMLIVKDNATCNITRDYGLSTVYVTVPNLEEIHCKTEQDIKSDGVLHFPNLKLFSIDLTDGAGTGDFYLNIDNASTYVESNNVSNFYLTGRCNNLHVFFSWGNGRFEGKDFIVENNLTFFQRSSNDMILFPLDVLEGNIYSTGNVILKNNPNTPPNVNEYFSGRLINAF